jgi:shikimate dehydrogenase
MRDRLVDLLGRLVADHRGVAKAGGEQVVIGLLGRGIHASRTPGMHEREATRLGLGYSYLLLDFDRLGLPDAAIAEAVSTTRELGFRGLNVTHPFKQAIIPALDRLSTEALAIGAVNTVVFDGGRGEGHNTDSWGFAQSFREGMPGASVDRIAVFGAGGAGAAVAYALMQLDAGHLAIVDSDIARAEELVRRIGAGFPLRLAAFRDASRAISDANGIVNATPIGMAKYPGAPFDTGLLTPDKWVADIIYFPAETELLRAARAVRCPTLPGIGMAIYQAVRAFELFTGLRADPQAMAGHFEAAA